MTKQKKEPEYLTACEIAAILKITINHAYRSGRVESGTIHRQKSMKDKKNEKRNLNERKSIDRRRPRYGCSAG